MMKTKLRDLIDATYDTGHYAGDGRSGTPLFNERLAERDALWIALEADIDALLGACKAIVRAEKGSVMDFFAAIDMAKEAIAKAKSYQGT